MTDKPNADKDLLVENFSDSFNYNTSKEMYRTIDSDILSEKSNNKSSNLTETGNSTTLGAKRAFIHVIKTKPIGTRYFNHTSFRRAKHFETLMRREYLRKKKVFKNFSRYSLHNRNASVAFKVIRDPKKYLTSITIQDNQVTQSQKQATTRASEIDFSTQAFSKATPSKFRKNCTRSKSPIPADKGKTYETTTIYELKNSIDQTGTTETVTRVNSPVESHSASSSNSTDENSVDLSLVHHDTLASEKDLITEKSDVSSSSTTKEIVTTASSDKFITITEKKPQKTDCKKLIKTTKAWWDIFSSTESEDSSDPSDCDEIPGKVELTSSSVNTDSTEETRVHVRTSTELSTESKKTTLSQTHADNGTNAPNVVESTTATSATIFKKKAKKRNGKNLRKKYNPEVTTENKMKQKERLMEDAKKKTSTHKPRVTKATRTTSSINTNSNSTNRIPSSSKNSTISSDYWRRDDKDILKDNSRKLFNNLVSSTIDSPTIKTDNPISSAKIPVEQNKFPSNMSDKANYKSVNSPIEEEKRSRFQRVNAEISRPKSMEKSNNRTSLPESRLSYYFRKYSISTSKPIPTIVQKSAIKASSLTRQNDKNLTEQSKLQKYRVTSPIENVTEPNKENNKTKFQPGNRSDNYTFIKVENNLYETNITTNFSFSKTFESSAVNSTLVTSNKTMEREINRCKLRCEGYFKKLYLDLKNSAKKAGTEIILPGDNESIDSGLIDSQENTGLVKNKTKCLNSGENMEDSNDIFQVIPKNTLKPTIKSTTLPEDVEVFTKSSGPKHSGGFGSTTPTVKSIDKKKGNGKRKRTKVSTNNIKVSKKTGKKNNRNKTTMSNEVNYNLEADKQHNASTIVTNTPKNFNGTKTPTSHFIGTIEPDTPIGHTIPRRKSSKKRKNVTKIFSVHPVYFTYTTDSSIIEQARNFTNSPIIESQFSNVSLNTTENTNASLAVNITESSLVSEDIFTTEFNEEKDLSTVKEDSWWNSGWNFFADKTSNNKPTVNPSTIYTNVTTIEIDNNFINELTTEQVTSTATDHAKQAFNTPTSTTETESSDIFNRRYENSTIKHQTTGEIPTTITSTDAVTENSTTEKVKEANDYDDYDCPDSMESSTKATTTATLKYLTKGTKKAPAQQYVKVPTASMETFVNKNVLKFRNAFKHVLIEKTEKNPCEENQLFCDYDKCIDEDQQCDQVPDCDDGTDEQECNYFDDEIFKRKLNRENRIDPKRPQKIIEPTDGSDEQLTTDASFVTTPMQKCPLHYFMCDGKCEKNSKMCDNEIDCKDGADENPDDCWEYYDTEGSN